jgi:hypothetical protein
MPGTRAVVRDGRRERRESRGRARAQGAESRHEKPRPRKEGGGGAEALEASPGPLPGLAGHERGHDQGHGVVTPLPGQMRCHDTWYTRAAAPLSRKAKPTRSSETAHRGAHRNIGWPPHLVPASPAVMVQALRRGPTSFDPGHETRPRARPRLRHPRGRLLSRVRPHQPRPGKPHPLRRRRCPSWPT